MDGTTVVEWGAEVDAHGVLDAAAAMSADPRAADLAALAADVAALAPSLDAARVRAAVEVAPRAVLAQHADGPTLALRWYEPGEVSTVHHHAWTILVGLDGEGTVERWSEAAGGSAVLRSTEGMHPGSVACLGEREVHRQRSGDAGSLELVLIADWSDAKPRIDLEPAPESDQQATLVDDWVRAYQQADADAVGALCTDDVFLDANVPRWRFQSQGRDDLVDLMRRAEFTPGYRVAEHRSRPTADGAVVELVARMAHDGADHLAREVLLLRCDDAGAVREITLFCTGIWDPATIERQQHDAVMIRP